MRNETKFKLQMMALVGSVAALAGCNTTQSANTASEGRLSWTKELEQQVESVPQVAAGDRSPLATPTVSPFPSMGWPVGAPRNLSNPIAAGGLKSGSGSTADASRKASDSTGGDRGSTVVVNVNGGASREPSAAEVEGDAEGAVVSRLETLYSGKFDREADRNLEQFGYDIFRDMVGSAHSKGPVPGNYVLGPGDEVVISLSGGVEAYYKIAIDREGYLTVPEFGPVPLAGKTYDSIYDSLMDFFEDRRRGFELTVSLGRLRDIQVSVIGRVGSPGIVEVSALATPLVALAEAGGAKKNGTLRNIVMSRTVNGVVENKPVDLYDYLRGTEERSNFDLLLDGDTIYVPAIGPTVGIAGYVQQPGIYELGLDSLTIEQAVHLAGGLTAFSFTPLARLERTIDGRGRQKIDFELNEEGLQREMGNGELLMVEAVDDARQPVVRIEGEVARPGEFQHRPGMKLSELVESADGLTVNAYLPQVIVSRQLGSPSAVETVPDRASHLQTRRVLVVDLAKALVGDPQHDLSLMPLDLVTVRSYHAAQQRPEVEIIGSVNRPGKYELTAGMRVSDLVAIARNPSSDVYYDQAELIRKVFDETVRRLDVERFRFNLKQALDPNNAYSDSKNPVLSNGDRLVIRSLQQAQVRVRIDGEVQFPGEYIFPAGAKITDLISAAGGVLDEADMRAAKFSRVSTRRLQEEKMDHLAERTRRLFEGAFEDMVKTGSASEGIAAKIALQHSHDALGRMKNMDADGRIVLPFHRNDFPESDYNLTLENGDTLDIPKRHYTVSVVGDVFRPLSLVAGEPISLGYALDQAGGLTEAADGNLLYVIRADGSVENIASKRSRLKKSTELLAGDVLLVPSKPMERGLGAQLGDVIYLARQAAETALVASRVGTDVDMTLVSPGAREQMGASADALLGDDK